jgi:hypothetical protein
MKKIIFILAFVLISSLSFGNDFNKKNTITNINQGFEFSIKKKNINHYLSIDNSIEYLGTCTITIEGYNQDGELVHYHRFSVQADSAIHCAQITSVFRMF